MATNKPNKLAFLSMPAPASYVAGLGRGASGFTTRSDIGPAREGPSAEVIAEAKLVGGRNKKKQTRYTIRLMLLWMRAVKPAGASRLRQTNGQRSDSANREAREQEELAKYRAERPKIQQQFSDLKRGLSSVTDEEWENIPEVGNLTRRKRRRDERSFVVPTTGGLVTPADSDSLTNFVEIGQARDKILSLKLDQVSGTSTASGLSTSIDPRGYLTSLDSASAMLKTSAEIGDIKRARMLFDSLVKSNPKHAPGWIAAACLEEHAGRMVAARKTIMQGCEMCPKSEDVWLEAARLHVRLHTVLLMCVSDITMKNNNDAKVVLANAVQHVSQSVKIWLAAAELESDAKSKKRVLRKGAALHMTNISKHHSFIPIALEHIPNSVLLWKQTVNLETSAVDARILLSRAVEVIPLSVDLWLALARLETPEKAKAVLNRARKSIPTSHEIWIAAARLLEQEADRLTVDKTIEAGVRGLRKHQVLLTREQWLKEAEKCESDGSPRTCEAIVKACIGMGLEDSEGDRSAMGEDEKLDVWLGDAEAAESRGKMGTARAIIAYALRCYPGRKTLWMRAAELEKAHGTRYSLDAILERAVHHCPQVEVLWLMAAKEKWLSNDVNAAREVLARAFGANPESEQIWLAAVKLEAENGEPGAARELLTRARSVADTERIWMKSAVFERQQGQLDLALETLKTALAKFPKFAKFYMIQGQIHESRGNIPKPERRTLPVSNRLEEKDGKSIKARSLLEKARLVNPANDELWAEAVHVEERAATTSSTTQAQAQAKAMLARGLQECPTSGVLWSMSIWSEARPSRKSRSVDALKKSADDPIIVCTVARLFWSERKIEKARTWFGRSVRINEDWGESWAWWLKFERMHGTEEHREEVRKRCVAAEPHHSPMWQSIAKDPQNTGKSIRDLLEMVADALN
ncbi:Pre-mRNA-processing factor [Salix suchowensis]|nr:Pre-mRNA-processing factor [Salix suchowensis]